MRGLKIQYNSEAPVIAVAENFAFALFDTAMEQDMYMDLTTPIVTIGSVPFRTKETK